jgi:poly-gamma-glutamate synthesis protein (capsule biosynthesis protein)
MKRVRRAIPLLLCGLALSALAGCFRREGEVVITPTAETVVDAGQDAFPTPLPPVVPPADAGAGADGDDDKDEPPPATPFVPDATPTPPPVVAGSPIRLWMAPNVPVSLQAALDPLVASGQYIWVSQQQAQVSLVSLPPGIGSPLTARWLYMPVMFFSAVPDSIELVAMQRYWLGDTAALAPLTPTGQPPVFVTTATALYFMTALFGPASPNVPIEVVPADLMAGTLAARGAAWGVVPFDQLTPNLKVLSMDGINILSRSAPAESWPLAETFGFVGDPVLVNQTSAAVSATGRWITVNRDPARLTALIMTGVTALVRATAWKMEVNGVLYPARDIAPFFLKAT